MGWREAELPDWTMIEEAACIWPGTHPMGAAEQATADLRLPYPVDKEMIRYVRAVIGAQIQEILRTEWGGLSEISNRTTGQVIARRLDGTGETLTALSPGELGSHMLRNRGLFMAPVPAWHRPPAAFPGLLLVVCR